MDDNNKLSVLFEEKLVRVRNLSVAGGQVLFLDRVAGESLSEEATLKQRHELYWGISQV